MPSLFQNNSLPYLPGYLPGFGNNSLIPNDPFHLNNNTYVGNNKTFGGNNDSNSPGNATVILSLLASVAFVALLYVSYRIYSSKRMGSGTAAIMNNGTMELSENLLSNYLSPTGN